MRTPTITHLCLLICSTLLLSPATTLEAEDRRFRLRIPNPIPRIVDRIGKVGDFVGRTARRIGDNEYENEIEAEEYQEEQRRRTQPPPPMPMGPPPEYIVVDPPYSERDPHLPMRRQYEHRARVGSHDRPELPIPSGDVPTPESHSPLTPTSKIVVVAPSVDSVTRQRTNEMKTPPSRNNGGRMMTTNPPQVEVETPLGESSPIATGPSQVEVEREGQSPLAATSPTVTDPSVAVAPLSKGSETSLNALKPESEPTGPAFGRPVHGHQGLVYPPGAKASPENRIDVRGIAPGTKVRDPSSGEIFLVP